MGVTFQDEANVVSLTRARMDMRFPVITEVHAYWEALRNGRPLPMRSEVDPRGIERALENAFVLERIAPGMARFRLAGMHLNDLMGMEVRGMPITALFEPAGRLRLSEALEQVFAAPSVLDLWLEGERGIGRPALEGRMTILPLLGTKGEPSLALGCLATVGTLGRAPRRFTIAGLVREPVRLPLAAKPEPVAAKAGFAEAAEAFAPRPPRGKPNLRLVSFNE